VDLPLSRVDLPLSRVERLVDLAFNGGERISLLDSWAVNPK